jgi:hypothetical protein
MSHSYIEWPAALIALAGSWLVGSPLPRRRRLGFACFLVSNLLWIVFACGIAAWGLLSMQTLFCLTSLRGLRSNRDATEA